MSEVKCTNLRFNLDKPVQRAAWECLQTMDKARFKSYSQVVALAVVDYFDRLEKLQDDPYLETREREERFVSQIVAAVERHEGCPAGVPRGLHGGPVESRSHHDDADDGDWRGCD